MNRIEALREGGKRLGKLTEKLYDLVTTEVSPHDIETTAQSLIREAGGTPSFQTVRNYKWATCICINEGVVHGVPVSTHPFADGDVVMVDVGLLFEGYHTDNAFTKVVGKSTKEKDKFLEAGKEALGRALETIKPGVHVGEISKNIQETLEQYAVTPARGLTGHGVGKKLHREPMIPCFLVGDPRNTPIITEGLALAIEVIYMQGSPELMIDLDGWTIRTKDGKLAAVFEETVEVTNDGHSILTKPALFQRF